MGLEESIKIYLDYCKVQNNLSDKTIRAYRIDLNQFSCFMEGKNYLEKDKIESYIYYIRNGVYKIKSIKRKIASLKAFYNFLSYKEYIEFNPFHKIKVKIKDTLSLPKIIPSSELNKLFTAIDDKLNQTDKSKYVYKELIRDRAILELLLATGIRISELCSLKRSDIMYSNNIIRILGKGSKERFVPIYHSRLISDLIYYEDLYSDKLDNFTYLFINKRNKKISSQSVTNMIKKYCNLANIDLNITPHMFRHTFATMLLDQDVDSRQIQILLGHSSIVTTQIYTNITSKKKKDIMRYKNPLSKIITADN